MSYTEYFGNEIKNNVKAMTALEEIDKQMKLFEETTFTPINLCEIIHEITANATNFVTFAEKLNTDFLADFWIDISMDIKAITKEIEHQAEKIYND